MPKGYVVTRVDILDPEAYAKYAAAATKAIADHGGKALAPKPQNPKTPKPQNFLHFNIYSLKLIRKISMIKILRAYPSLHLSD